MPPSSDVNVVDSHAHIISSDPHAYPYAPATGALPEWLSEPGRSVDANELLERMPRAGVNQAVLVQYSSVHGFDNRYVLDTARDHPDRFVAVCAIDGREPDAPARLAECVARGAAGLRIRAPYRTGPLDWLDCPDLLQRAVELHVPVAIHLTESAHNEGLKRIRAILERFPRLTVVLDHAGNPPWRDRLDAVLDLASFERLYIKFATVNLERLQHAGVAPEHALERLVAAFTAQRIMWGSDAPNTPGNYTHMVDWMTAAISNLAQEDRHWIMGGTALEVYPRLAAHGEIRHAGMSFA